MSDTSFVVVVLNFVRRRKRRKSGSHQQPAPVVLPPLARVTSTVAHFLPATLGLACMLFLADTWWHESLKSSDAWAMRKVDQLSKWSGETRGLGWLASKRFKDSLETGAAFYNPGVSLVTLSPEAHGYFFGRQSPLPRGRLACLISVFAEHLEVLNKANQPLVRRVVGLDFDITPVANTVEAETGSSAEPSALVLSADAKSESICAAPASAHQMRAALRALQRQADVVAIIYPRQAEPARKLRNDFIRDTCRCPDGTSPPSSSSAPPDACSRDGNDGERIWYASAQVLHPPLELVTEYPTKRKPLLPSTLDYVPPPYFPTLGGTMAFVSGQKCTAEERRLNTCKTEGMQEQRLTADHYCSAVWDYKHLASVRGLLLDDRLAVRDSTEAFNLPNAFEYENIKFGPAQSKIVVSNVYPPPERRASDDYAKTPDELRTGLQNGLRDLQQSSAFILAIDSGTTEDKFLVPVLADETVGGWLHAAITISETTTLESSGQAGHDQKSESASESSSPWQDKAGHLFQDVVLGLALACLMTLLTYAPRASAPVFSGVAVAVWPLMAGSIVTTLGLLWAGHSFEDGRWHNPLLMCVGFVLHVYLEGPHLGAATHVGAQHSPQNLPSSPAFHPAAKSRWTAFDKGLRQWLQIAWCGVVVTALAFVVVDAHSRTWHGIQAVLFGLALTLASAAYWLLASRQWTWLPLPWREAGHKPH